MNDKLNTPQNSCNHCPLAPSQDIIIAHLLELKAKLGELLEAILGQLEKKTVYRNAEYVYGRVGISESTLLRCRQKGLIQVAKVVKKKNLYRDEDVEHLRRIYRDLG